jgi:uncharacterized protein Yka (UPF0111/DUF47 family)
MNFKDYIKESTQFINENSEAVELRKHLHDQQMKYAAAQKRKDKRAMDFWNKAIKNTEEELKYYDNENFSSIESSNEKENPKISEYERKIDQLETKLGKLINSGGKPAEIAKIRRVINNYEDLLHSLS